jgi:hypothetical protein
MRHYRYGSSRHRCHIMIEYFQRERMEIDKIARHMNRNKLPQAVAIVDVAGHKSFKQQYALAQHLTCYHDVGPRRQRLDLPNGRFEPRPLLNLKVHAAPVSEKPLGEHECVILSK